MSDCSELTDCHRDEHKWEYNLCCDKRFATWLKTKNGDWHWRKTPTASSDKSIPTSYFQFRGVTHIIIFRMFSKRQQCVFSPTSFPPSYSPSFRLLLKAWTPPPKGSDSSGVTTLHGVKRTVMPLNLPQGNQSRGGLSFGPIQKRPIWKGAKPSPRRSEGCLQNNSLLSAVCFPEESPPQTDNSLQMGARVWPIGV